MTMSDQEQDRLLREDNRHWRFKNHLPATLDLLVYPHAYDRHPSRPVYGTLMFHTRHCSNHPPYGHQVQGGSWRRDIPTPIVEALWASATAVHPLPYAVDNDLFDHRISFCRACLLEADPEAARWEEQS